MLRIDSLKKTYTNEEIAIILLTRLYFKTQGLDEVQSFLHNEQIDWLLFYKIASDNDIQGFIYDVISVSNIQINANIYDALKKEAMGIALVSSYQQTLLDDLLSKFKEIGVQAIPYKGYSLASRYYRSPIFRKGSDLDFFVDQKDLPILIDLLQQEGYTHMFSISARHINYVQRHLRELPFVSPRAKIGLTCSVELKWKLLENYLGNFLTYDYLINHVKIIDNEKGTIGLHPTYDFLCVASHHLIRESLHRFKYVIDLASIIQTSSHELDWDTINKQFKAYNFSSALYSGLNALKEVVGISVPVQSNVNVRYKLFSATSDRRNGKVFLQRARLINRRLTFLEKIKYGFKVRLFLFFPSLNDLERINYPIWMAILPLSARKLLRFIYKRIIPRKR